jgi:arylformamidase
MNLEVEYDNRARVPGHPAIIEGWMRDAAAWRRERAAHAEFDISYGARERSRLDLFRAENPAAGAPLAVFIHGGYWRTFDKSVFSHIARGANLNGFDMALPGYSLCPAVSVLDIVDELRQACLFLWSSFRRPLVVAGHSAGGHLAACMMATQWDAYGAPAGLVRAGFAISGLYDLRPLLATTVNGTLKLTEKDAIAASPLWWPAPRAGQFEAWVGGAESAEYLRQTASLVAAWNGVGLDVRHEIVPLADHFSILGALADPASPMSIRLSRLCGP